MKAKVTFTYDNGQHAWFNVSGRGPAHIDSIVERMTWIFAPRKSKTEYNVSHIGGYPRVINGKNGLRVDALSSWAFGTGINFIGQTIKED